MAVRPGRWHGELRTGRLRPATVGEQSSITEVVVKTWCEDDADDCPKVGTRIRTTVDGSSWFSVEQQGALTINDGDIVGSGTPLPVLSHTIAEAASTDTVFEVPASPRKCRIYEDSTLLTGWTYDAWDVTLGSAKTAGTNLAAYWSGAPQQVGGVGDIVYIPSTDQAAVITAIATNALATSEWGPQSELSCQLIPAKEMEPGNKELALGCLREVDDLEIQAIVAPQDSSSSVLNKVKELIVVGFRTGEERFGDEEGA